MAIKDQPYLPLYVDDWMNNLKLKSCSIGAHGLMITIMCLMHKSNVYGKLLLRQKFEQVPRQKLGQKYRQLDGFCYQIAKYTSFDLPDIMPLLTELIEEEVLVIEKNYLVSPRMVRDAEISARRSVSGKLGASATHGR